jgi:hypothetical protein
MSVHARCDHADRADHLLSRGARKVEDGMIAPVSNGMGDQLKPWLVRPLELGIHFFRVLHGVAGRAIIGGIVGIWRG